MTHDEMIEVIKAHRDGKAIQIASYDEDNWIDLHLEPRWTFNSNRYRIKPTPKIRPWKPEEGVGKVVRLKGDKARIIMIIHHHQDGTFYCNGWVSPKWLLDNCEQLDGSPCGVVE